MSDGQSDVANGDTEVPGLDLNRIRAFFEDAGPGAVAGPLRASLIAGGKSNLTYEVSDGRSCWIVRRPPLGHVLATAHDMSREYRVMTALHDTDVPVPETYWLCEDPAVIGAPFYVMEKVDGTPYRFASQLAPLGPERTATLSMRVIDTLATLHAVDPASVGLSDFGSPQGFLDRQVRRWKKQLDASRSRDLAGADALAAALRVHLPHESSPGIVHGDYRLDNLLVDDRDEVAAVIDWEMATIGDPLTDVALLMVYQRMAELEGGHAIADAGTVPGYLSNEQMLARYDGASHRDLSAMGFYLGLAFFKIAVILEGIHYRYIQGLTVGAGFDTVGAVVEPLLDAGIAALKECN